MLSLALSGCAQNSAQGLHNEAFPAGKAIPLKVAIIYNGVSAHHGVDTNHDMGKLKYNFTLDTGKIMVELLQQRMTRIFSDVVFIPDIESLQPGYLPLIPKDLVIKTENGKLSRNFRCGNTGYPIRGSASFSLLLATPGGDPIVEYSAADSQELEGTWNAYCVGKKQVGGASDTDYLKLVALAMKNVMARIEGDIRVSGTLSLYADLQESLPRDILMDRWQHMIVLEGGNAGITAPKDPLPFKAVMTRVQKEMDEYLAPRSPYLAKTDLPQTIEPPDLPPLSEMQGNVAVQEELEDEESQLRPAPIFLPERRDLRVLKFQVQFRKAVERRNQRLSNVKNDYMREIGIINNEQEAKKSLSTRRYFSSVRSNMLDVMGAIHIKDSAYDSASGKLMLTLEAAKAEYAIQAGFTMPAQEAQALMQAEKSPAPIIEFITNEDGVRLSSVRLYSEGRAYEASLPAGTTATIALGTVFNYKILSFTEQDAVTFAPQNPNLPDPSYLSIIAPSYSDEAGEKGFIDDLTPILRSIPSATPLPDKWLVAIGIERYIEADRVLFGTRSYMLFADAAQRALRIPKDHVLGLLNDQATAQGISNVFAELLKKAKAGDTIYFYYGGHIARDYANNRLYLLPQDMIPDVAISEGRFRIETVLDTMLTIKPERIVVFLDAGTSGKTDNIPVMKGQQHVPIVKQEFAIDPERITLITACRYDQSSNTFIEKRHRMFSYHLIKDLASSPNADLTVFFKKLSDDVLDSSLRRKDIYRQDPQIYGNTKGKL